MNPLLRIVNYLLKNKNIVCDEEELDNFFDNGVSFPQFIASIFDIEEIPNINQNPKNEEQRNLNNSIALEFLFQENQEIAQISPSFYTSKDKSKLITLILTKQCFNINIEKIISKCNMIVQPIELHYSNIYDIIKLKTILSLLHILTDKKVQMDYEINDFDSLMPQIFEKANVPLVIDKSSLQPPNQFLFLIQILIIFDIFSDKIKQIKKQNSKSENDHLKFCETDELENLALLKTINGIVKIEKLYFNSILEATRGENAYKFVKLFFKEDIEFIEKLNASQKNIESIIELLGEKEPIFNILLFNFNDPKYEYSSSILFYSNFLNFFFLKKSRQELFERCSTIIFSLTRRDDFFFNKLKENILNRKNPYLDKSLLFIWETYLALLYFLNERDVHFKVHIHENYENYFDKKNIPQVIDENFVEKCNSKEKDALYYQLQFIFNALDNENFDYRYTEMMLSAIRLIKNVKVPKFTTLSENIRVKNVSLILQKKRYTVFLNGENKDENVKLDLSELNMLKKEKPKETETFKQRKEKQKNVEEPKQQNENNLIQSELFWNPVDNDYSIDNGILFMKNEINELDKEWIDCVSNYEKDIERNSNDDQLNPLFSSFPTIDAKSEYHKLFIYNEKSSKWEINSSSISSFFTKRFIKEANFKLPLVFFSNSYEDELIELNSKLINFLPPDLDDDEIYVYGLCDKNLSLMEYNVVMSHEKSQIKPILLFLHVPKSKENIENIKTIILKINYFLSIICDIEVVVLNKKYYKDQIELIKSINNIKSSYQKTVDLKEENNFFVSSNDQSNHDNDFSSDGDEGFEEEESIKQHSLNNMNNLIENINLKFFKKQAKYILLVNYESIQGDIININDKSEFLSNIRNQVSTEFCDIWYINVKDTVTYRCFLSSFNKVCLNVDNKYDDVMKYFDLIKITDVSNMYINLKSKEEWKSELKTVIENRFEQYQLNNIDKLDDLSLIYQLYEEIMTIYPSIDSDFYNECNLIINMIKNNVTKTNSENLAHELNVSSESNLKYLKEIINGQFYWDLEKRDSIENSHINFLEKEFYSIIAEFYSKRDYPHVLKCCQSILQNQIEKDVKIIKNYFADFEKNAVGNHSNDNDISQSITMLDEINKRTDFSIRESERVREIKVVVEEGHLVNEIEQDF